MPDNYEGKPAFAIGSDYPANGGEAVTPSNSTNLGQTCRALYVGGTGDLSLVMRDGTSIFITAAAVGYHPLRVVRVNATTGGTTTATNIVALY